MTRLKINNGLSDGIHPAYSSRYVREIKMAGVLVSLHPSDCDPPHGLDMDSPHDAQKVWDLVQAFEGRGFDLRYPALVGYPLEGRVQLLSGTHRHRAATIADVRLPVTLWLRSDVEKHWGNLEKWTHIIKDIPAMELMLWTREDLERYISSTSQSAP